MVGGRKRGEQAQEGITSQGSLTPRFVEALGDSWVTW